MRLSPSELARLAYQQTGWRGEDLVIAVAIALGESGGDPVIQSKVDKADEKWGVSTGLWQIRPLQADKGKGGPRDETLLTDPVHNARSAFQIYTFAGGFSPWGAFTNGSYKRHYDAAKQGVQMAWRLVNSLKKLRSEVDALAPNRDRSSDGTIGDSAHSSRRSDHNPEGDGTVDALDITHDPAGGCDVHGDIFPAIVAKKDRRVKYLISNARILSGRLGPQPWVWRPYGGSNPHRKHGHISVLDEGQDDTSPWLTKEDWFDMATKEDLQAVVADALKTIEDRIRRIEIRTRLNNTARTIGTDIAFLREQHPPVAAPEDG